MRFFGAAFHQSLFLQIAGAARNNRAVGVKFDLTFDDHERFEVATVQVWIRATASRIIEMHDISKYTVATWSSVSFADHITGGSIKANFGHAYNLAASSLAFSTAASVVD